MSDLVPYDPTATVDIDFGAYISRRREHLLAHMQGGVPDYAFSLDARIRASLSSIAALRTVAQALNSATVPIQRQLMLMDGVAVGPNQFPEIFRMAEECARILGIAVPQVFIKFDPSPNGWTYCTSDVDQIIVITTGLVQACEPTELLSVIGHECGHIHNQHVVYNTIWEMLTNPLAQSMVFSVLRKIPGLGTISSLLETALPASLWYIFGRWHRCAEITCDRAGLICCGDLRAALDAEGKLRTGGVALLEGFNAEEYARQREQLKGSPVRLLEALRAHPIGPTRVEALRHFGECEVLFRWRPEMRGDAPARDKEEVDRTCERLLI